MATPTYKLTYFNGRGLAEIIRLVLTAADVPFEDIRITHEDHANLKPTLPFGQIPILEIDSKVTLCQSHAIARYLARKYNLAGKTELEQAQADMIVDCIDDVTKPILNFLFQVTDAEKKEELKKKYLEEQLPEYLTKLEAMLASNKSGEGYFVGEGLTWADLYLIRFKEGLSMSGVSQNPLDKHLKLKALCDRVVNLPKIVAYQSKLPATDY